MDDDDGKTHTLMITNTNILEIEKMRKDTTMVSSAATFKLMKTVFEACLNQSTGYEKSKDEFIKIITDEFGEFVQAPTTVASATTSVVAAGNTEKTTGVPATTAAATNSTGNEPFVSETLDKQSKLTDWLKTVYYFYPVGGQALFEASVYIDMKDTKNFALYLDQGGLSLPDKRYYTEKEEFFLKARTELKARLEAMGKFLGFTSAEAFKNNVWAFETKLAEISFAANDEEREDSNLQYNKVTVGNLTQEFPIVNWIRYYKPFDKEVTENTSIVLTNYQYFQKLNELVAATDESKLQQYFIWRFAKDWVRYLSTDLQTEAGVPASRRFTASPTTCTAVIQSWIPFGAGRLYVAKYFTKGMKTDVENMVQYTKRAFLQRVETRKWMSEETKAKAKEKATKMRVHVGYPDDIYDNGKLDQRYKYFVVKEHQSFFDVAVDVKRSMERTSRGMYNNETVDLDKWIPTITPIIVNAFYSPASNSMYMLAGILSEPFYNPNAPFSVKFGHIGSIIGHEITHGFDSSGAKFGPNGNMKNWWSQKSLASFTTKVQCAVHKYNNYTVIVEPNRNWTIDGELTSGENIADIGGLIEAYYGYKLYVKEKGKEPKLPGINLQNEKSLYIAFAQNWCGRRSPASLKQLLLINPHAPREYRVLGSLTENEEFSEQFNCKVGSKYRPKKNELLCDIW